MREAHGMDEDSGRRRSAGRSIPSAPQRTRVQYGRDTRTTRISVQCVEGSHAERAWLVDSFYVALLPGTGRPLWMNSLDYYRNGEAIARLASPSRAALVGDEWVSDKAYEEDPTVFDSRSRSRYRLHCRVCGLTVTSRAEKLEPVFTKLVSVGVSEVSLSALASILR